MTNRRTILDFPRNEAGLVDEFIGTAYDAMYAIYQNLDALLNVNLNVEAAISAAAQAKQSALDAAFQADRAQKIVDDFEAGGGDIDLRSLGIYIAQAYGLVGGAGIEESKSINTALDACGKAGGGVVVVRAKKDGDPIYINKPVQIEQDNVVLQFESPVLYGPKGTMRVSGNYKEIRRTWLGQTDLIAIASDTTVDEVGEMQFTVRPNEGRFLVVGDRVTLRGENDAVGNALEKQTVTIKAINGDVISCYDVPEMTFRAVYPNSEWEPDKTTGTTVSIVNYSAFTANNTGPNVIDVEVEDGTKFTVGELVYVSDARKERDLIQERDLVSAAIMEHAIIAKITGNIITFDKPLQRQYLKTFKGGISSLKAIFNSHIRMKELSWAAPQPDRKNSCIGINFGWKCTVKFDRMLGREGRVGTAMRIAYSFDCEMYESEIHGGYSFASAESYGAVMYYSTFCRLRNNFATGSRHNYLIQTCVSCDILDNISTDDYISGIDLHGAGALNCRIMGNRVSRSKNYSPDAGIGGGIRNGNTSHVIGDHGTLIYNNYIEGYNNRNDSNGRYESAAIDVSPASNNVIVRDNHMVDCSIGFRHYRISPAILVQRVSNRIILIGNTFERISEKLVQMDIGTNGNSLVQELILIDNKSVNNSKQFEINDVPKVRLINNQIIAPVVASGVYGFRVTKCPDLVAVGNFAVEANRGFQISDCPGAKVFKNVLDLTREDVPFTASGSNNVGYVERGNTLADSGGSGATIQIGTVTTGAPGTNAIVTNSGTETDAIFNFTIPRGIPGEPGGGSGGEYSPSQNVQDLDALVGVAQRLLMFDAGGRLAQFQTGVEGRTLMQLASLADAKDHLGISQVNNTPDAEKPVSTPQAEAIAQKADINGPVFTGRPFTPNPAMPLNPAYAQQIAPAQWTLDQIDAKIALIPTPSGGAANPYKTFALFGDSLSGNNSKEGMLFTRGFITWANMLSGQRVIHDSSLNFGVGSETSTQIAARVATVIAAAPDIVLFEAGGNDYAQSVAPETTIANLKTVLDAFKAAGIKCIICTIYPTFATTTPAHWSAVAKINAWIMEHVRAYPQTEVLDAYSTMWDFVGNVRCKQDYTYDATHTGSRGGFFLGKELAKIFEKWAPLTRNLPSYNSSDAINVTTFTDGNLISNGRFAGNTGTVRGSGVTGSVPDGWIVDASGANGVTTTITTGVDANGVPTLKLAFTGTTVANAGSTFFAQSSRVFVYQEFGQDGQNTWKDTDLGKLIRDNLLSCSAKVKATKVTGMGGAGVLAYYIDAQGGTRNKPLIGDCVMTPDQSALSRAQTAQSMTIPEPFEGIVHHEPYAVGKPAGLRLGMIFDFPAGVPVDAAVEFNGVTFRRIPIA